MNRNRILIIVAIVVVLAGGAFAARSIFLSDAPAEVDLADSTAEPVTTGADTGLEGNWSVDTASGEFNYDAEQFTSSWAGYRVDEELAGIGANTAVGRTPNVEGTLMIAGNQITDVDVTVDMTTLQSDNDMRDRAIGNRGLETGRYPTATFKLAEPITIDDEPAAGETIEAQATGDLTLHGVTKRITIPIEARQSGGRITVVTNFDVALADYDMERPTTARVLSVSDTGTVEMQLHFAKS